MNSKPPEHDDNAPAWNPFEEVEETEEQRREREPEGEDIRDDIPF